MSVSIFQFCAIPEPYWQGVVDAVDIARFAREALACERRIAKEVNLENEHARYTLLCQQLEREVWRSGRLQPVTDQERFRAALLEGQFPVQMAEPGYIALLSAGDESDLAWRLGTSIFPPDSIEDHRRRFSNWCADHNVSKLAIAEQRIKFLDWAAASGCGIVEIQSAFHSESSSDPGKMANLATLLRLNDTEQSVVEIPAFALSGLETDSFTGSERKQESARALHRQIREALKTDGPVSFGNQAPHDVITEVLHEYVFVPSGADLKPTELRISYADGSEAESFPLFCLHERDHDQALEAEHLRVALMSMRHLEMDLQVDYCWFRNREVSRTRTLSETDRFCYDSTMTQLRDCLASGALSMQLFHTGFEPAVIGFYRGVVQTLLVLRELPDMPSLAVTPFYFRGESKPFHQGGLWR